MSQTYVYSMYRANKFFGPERQVLREISLSFLPGAKIGVLGPNGAGKSTLLRIMAGLDEPSNGEARIAPGATVGYLPQEPELDEAKDVRGNVEDGVAEKRGLLDRYNEISARFAEPMSDDEMQTLLEEQGEVQDRIDRTDAWSLDRMLDVAMDALRLPPADAEVTNLSGGERRRIALCRLLLSSPDLLLLDEPTNHLDAESVAWLERFLDDYAGTVLAVTHDRYFLDNVAGWILELDRGHGIPFQGNYSSWLEQKQARLAVEEKQESARRRTLQRELEWVRMAPRARHAKSRARVQAYDQLLAEEKAVKLDTVEIHIPAGARLGDVVVETQNLRKGYGDRLLIDDLTFSLPAGGIVGVIGPNGAGKTTLFRMIAGEEQPDAGELRVGPTVELAYVDQARSDLDPAATVWKEISGGKERITVGPREVASRAYVASFNFRGGDQQKRVGDLSGGERNRLHLAKLLRSGGNLLLLDEPTNDLDVDTLRALEDALVSFAGCAVVISHDRWFLDRIATHILAFEGDSQVVWFEGAYDEYEEHRHKRLGAEADQPHRIRYKPLVRP
ncbi:MAG TPA: energy-dependent translational throttle protein EttA [Gaiellales bacterium]